MICLYGPNKDSPEFYSRVSDTIEDLNNQSVLITGDYNLVQNQNLDTYNYQNVNNPKAKEKVLNIIENYDLTDPYRELYPELKKFTWRKNNPIKQARLDFYLISQGLNQHVHDIHILNSYRSDHSPIMLHLKMNNFIIGKGLWKFNNSLLHDIEYSAAVKETINNDKEQYASLVYNRGTLEKINDLEIQFTINDQLFLETLLTEIRGKSISYASFRKKQKDKKERILSEDIKKLEEQILTEEIFIETEKKKTDLKVLRQEKMKGSYIRSKIQWIEEGEKPSNFFLN